MPDNQYKEVLIVLIVCMTLFLLLAGIILLFLFLYRRRRTIQQLELRNLQQQFTEQSLKAQLEIQEHTFQAISQEIHDNVGQILSLARIQVNIVTERREMDESMLQSVKENIGKALTDLRDLSRSMNGDRIRNCPIHETLLLETERINRTGIVWIAVAVSGEIRELDAGKKLILFRILQESIQNCLKHAEAGELDIRFVYREKAIEVVVRDNGRGFDVPAALDGGRGQGLANIQTRTRLTGGVCAIESQPGEGTSICLNIPYE